MRRRMSQGARSGGASGSRRVGLNAVKGRGVDNVWACSITSRGVFENFFWGAHTRVFVTRRKYFG